MMRNQLEGKYTFNQEGKLRFMIDGIQKAFKEGRGIILNEFNKLPGDLKGPINGFLDQL